MLISKEKIKKIISSSLLFLVVFSIFISPTKTSAVDETIKLERTTCAIEHFTNNTTGNWMWGFKITSTELADNTKIFVYLYKGPTTIESKTRILKGGSALYQTGYILEPETAYTVNITVDGKPKLTTSGFTEKTPKNGETTCTPGSTPATTASSSSSKTTDTKTTYTLLAPLPGLGLDGSSQTIETDPQKNPCPFGYYLNIMIKLFLGICGVLAVIMIVMGGVQYMTSELVSSKEEGKKSITNAIFGLILALAAYLILNTINPDLLNICLNNLPKAEITIVKDDNVPQAPINGKYCTNTTGTNGGYPDGANWETIAGARATLPNGFVTNTGECSKVGDKNCTSLRGLSLSTLDTIKAKCTNCGTITISGGTECWLHGGPKQSTTHHPGSPTIDLRLNSEPKLDAYIKSGTKKGSWYTKDNISYLLEADHWHVGN